MAKRPLLPLLLIIPEVELKLPVLALGEGRAMESLPFFSWTLCCHFWAISCIYLLLKEGREFNKL